MNPQAVRRKKRQWALEISKPTPRSHFLQQRHTCSNKVTPNPSIVPLPNDQAMEQAILVQITTEGFREEREENDVIIF